MAYIQSQNDGPHPVQTGTFRDWSTGRQLMREEWTWPGSRWWRMDLHTHSPESQDFDRESDDVRDWLGWIEATAKAGLDAVAITDHNTAAGISEIQDAAIGVTNAPVLFPGVEVTASDGVHLLVLADPQCSRQHVDDLLSRSGISVDARGLEHARSRLSVEQILDHLGRDAVILGAHVNGPKGILDELRGQQRLAVLRNSNLAAVEVDPETDLDESWLDGSKSEVGRRIPRIWASDGHSFEDLGRRFTWVKMTRPDVEGLRLALLDGTSSLKCATGENPGDPNAQRGELLIEGVTVADARFMGRSEPVAIRFNPWLNAIIGGRGTGKSTLVDLCRKTLRREAELDASGDRGEEGSLRRLFERRMRIPPSRKEGLLTESTHIEVIYRKHGERFALSWNRHGAAPAIARLIGDRHTPEVGSISERFPVRIYSQKQLFALAQDPDALLAIIDDSPDVQAAEKNREIEHLMSAYLSQRAQARAAAARASGLSARRAALSDVQRKLDFLQEGGQARRLSEYRRRRQQHDLWNAVVEAAWEAVRDVAVSVEQLSVADWGNVRLDSEDDPSWASLDSAQAALTKVVGHLRSTVLTNVEATQDEIRKILESEDVRRWQKALADSEVTFREATAELAERGIRDPGEYNNLLSDAARLEREIQALEQEHSRAQQFARGAAETLERYREQRRALGATRGAFAADASGEIIRVDVAPLANNAGLSGGLVGILGTERFEADRKALADRIRGQHGEWSWERLDGVVMDIRRFLAGQVDSWPTEDHRFEAALKRVPPERIDRLALYAPDDSVGVHFRGRNGKWQPLTQGSPGQQTAALLAFVLGHGSEPIILDQPEDDLDNTLIYDLLVSQLKEAKLRRQVIVVTHNPNIVVHGDAEFVLSLEAGEGQSRIGCSGGLQEEKVREEICRVMEGGREAFESRYRRIMPARGSVS